MIVLVDLAEVERLPGGSSYDWGLGITIVAVCPLPSVLTKLSCTTYISTLLGHGCEDSDIGAIIIFLCPGLGLLATITSQLGSRVPHTGEHDVGQLLLAQTLVGRVEDGRAG